MKTERHTPTLWRDNVMGLDIFQRGQLPRWLPVRQQLNTEQIDDVYQNVATLFQANDITSAIPVGSRVALAVGSRGIHRLDEVVTAIIRCLRELQAEPFIVPSMGSHGGATAEGQVAILQQLGIVRSEEHTSELQSRGHLVCRLLLEKKT